MPTFRFVQFEYPWPLGPADGRYVVRDAEASDAHAIVVLSTLGAPQRRLLASARRRRRPQPAPPVATGQALAPAAVATGRATIVAAAPLPTCSGPSWLQSLDAEAETEQALATLNRVIQAHRIASADPYVHEVSPEQALAIRAGYGDGEDVAEGRWREAVTLAPAGGERRRRRASVLRPQERLAALLGARDSALACEELALRARADVDHARFAAAALTTRLALDASLVELAPAAQRSPDIGERLGELRELRDGVVAAANSALAAPLTDAQRASVARALERIEAVLRARTSATLS